MAVTALRAAALTLLATFACLPAVAAPAVAKRSVPQGFVGTVFDGEAAAAPASVQDAQWARMAQSGVESVRTVFSWAGAQPVEGSPPSFAATDAVVARAVRHGIRLLPIVMNTPAWALSNPALWNSPPRDPAEYAAYVRALVRRYGPTGSFWVEHTELPRRPLREWQIWNEPHLQIYWAAPGWQEAYGRLLAAAHDAVKAEDPRATVVLAGLTGASWDALEELYTRGHARGNFDVAALQTYTSSPRLLLRAARLFRRTLVRHHDGRIPTWITEFSWPAARGHMKVPSYQRTIATTRADMARKLSWGFNLFARIGRARDVGVTRAYWYTWSSPYRPSGDPGTGIFRFAGLYRYTGRGGFAVTPAARAFRTVARKLEGCAKTAAGACRH